MTEVVVTRKGQVTSPVKIRRKFGIEENSKVKIIEQDGITIIKKSLSIFDLADNGAGKGDVNELKKMLNQMRNEDT